MKPAWISRYAPGEDFNRYANGTWIKEVVIPPDRSYWGDWDILRERAWVQVRDILEAATKSPAPPGSKLRKIGDYYSSFMDERAVEREGAKPLAAALDAIRQIGDYRALATAMGNAVKVGVSMPIDVFFFADFKNSDTGSAYQPGAGSALHADRAVRNLMLYASIPFERAIVSATSAPARLLGLEGECGTIARGKRADLSIWSDQYEILATIVGGEPVHGAQHFTSPEATIPR